MGGFSRGPIANAARSNKGGGAAQQKSQPSGVLGQMSQRIIDQKAQPAPPTSVLQGVSQPPVVPQGIAQAMLAGQPTPYTNQPAPAPAPVAPAPAPQGIMPAEYYTSGLSPEHAAYGQAIRQQAAPQAAPVPQPMAAPQNTGVLSNFMPQPTQQFQHQPPPIPFGNKGGRGGKGGAISPAGRNGKGGGMQQGQQNNPTLLKQSY